MNERANEVRITIVADSKPADAAIKNLGKNINAQTERMRGQMAESGRRMGDSFGRGMQQSTDRWMRAIQGSLRTYFGSAGRIVADAIEQFDRYQKAITSARPGGPSGTNVGLPIAGEVAAGSFIGSGGASTLASWAGKADKRLLRMIMGPRSLEAARNVRKLTNAIRMRRRLESQLKNLNSDDQLDEQLLRGEKDANMEIRDLVRAGHNLTNKDIMDIHRKHQSRWEADRKEKMERLNDEIHGVYITEQNARNMNQYNRLKSSGIVGRLFTSGAFRSGAIGLGATATGVGLAGYAIKSSADNRDESAAMEQRVAQLEILRQRLEAIKNPAQKAAEMIRLLGTDGYTEYKKLNAELEKSQRLLLATTNTRAYQATNKALVDMVTDEKTKLVGMGKEFMASYSPMGGIIRGIGQYFGINPATINAKAKGDAAEQSVNEMWNRVFVKLAKGLEEEAKAREELVKMVDEENKLLEERNQKLAEGKLDTATNRLMARAKLLNPDVQEPSDAEALLSAESDRLGNVGLSSAELLLKSAKSGRYSMGSKATKALLESARARGAIGSFKSRIGSAAEEELKKNAKNEQAQIDTILKDYLANGGAFKIVPRNGE